MENRRNHVVVLQFLNHEMVSTRNVFRCFLVINNYALLIKKSSIFSVTLLLTFKLHIIYFYLGTTHRHMLLLYSWVIKLNLIFLKDVQLQWQKNLQEDIKTIYHTRKVIVSNQCKCSWLSLESHSSGPVSSSEKIGLNYMIYKIFQF